MGECVERASRLRSDSAGDSTFAVQGVHPGCWLWWLRGVKTVGNPGSDMVRNGAVMEFDGMVIRLAVVGTESIWGIIFQSRRVKSKDSMLAACLTEAFSLQWSLADVSVFLAGI